MSSETNQAADSVLALDAETVGRLLAGHAAATAALTAMAEAVQAQAVALHALADAIAAPIEDAPMEDNRPRYLDGSPIEP